MATAYWCESPPGLVNTGQAAWQFLKRVNIESTTEASNSTPKYMLQRRKNTYTHTHNVHKMLQVAAIQNIQEWKEHNCPPAAEWMDKMPYWYLSIIQH